METKDYYKELEHIVRSARPNYWLRIKYSFKQWWEAIKLKCFGKSMTEENRMVQEMLVQTYKLMPFVYEVFLPLVQATGLITLERNLGNCLMTLTQENAFSKSLLTHAEVFDILLKLPSIKIHNILTRLYPNHYQQLVAALDADDKMYFVRYIDEQRLDTKPLSNLCSCFLMEHRMSQYTGNLSEEERAQLGAEISSMAQAGEMITDEDILKLSGILANASQLRDSDVAALITEHIYNYYSQSLIIYFLYRSRLNPVEQRAVEAIVKNPRYIRYYNDVSEAYQKINAEDPGLEERILQKEQALRLKPTKPLEQSSAKAKTSNRMPKKPSEITEEQIPLLVDELVKAGFINQTDREKFVYFLTGEGGSYNGPLHIRWNKTYPSLKYLFQSLLYDGLPKNSNKPIDNNFDYEKPTGGAKYNPDTFRNKSKEDLLPLIGEKNKADLDQIMAKLKS